MRTPAELAVAATLRSAEVARLMGVSETLVRSWIKRGVIPTVEVPGATRLVPREAWERWLAEQTRGGR